MIVVDTSVFVDALFEYDEERTRLARNFFRLVQEKRIPLIEPDIFKVELIGQLVRRLPQKEALNVYELIIQRVEIVDTSRLSEVSFEVALNTGCRAIDSFYISIAHSHMSVLVSNDRFQVKSARKYGVEAFYLIEEYENLSEFIKSSKDKGET